MVSPIRNIELALLIDRDISGSIELPGPITLFTPFG